MTALIQRVLARRALELLLIVAIVASATRAVGQTVPAIDAAADRFVARAQAGDAFVLGFPLNAPVVPASVTWLPGTPGGLPVSEIIPGSSWWRKLIKGAAVVLGGVGGGLGAAAAAAPATGGLGSVPAAIWGAGAAGGAAGTAAAALLCNLPEEKKKSTGLEHLVSHLAPLAFVPSGAQDIEAYGSIVIDGVDVADAYVARLMTGLLAPRVLPGGGVFTPSTAITTRVVDNSGGVIPNATGVFGLLQIGSTVLPTTLVDYDFSLGTRGILPTDYLDSDVEWLQAQFPQVAPGDLVLGESIFCATCASTVPEPATLLLAGSGLVALAALRYGRRRRPWHRPSSGV